MQSDSASTTETLRWLPITAAVSSISVVGIAIGLGTPLLSIILETRGYSASMIGLNTAIAGFATIAAAPLSTPLATRFGVVWTMLAMIFIGALSIIGFYFATAFWMWFPLRAILHVALTVLFILSEFWISTSAPPSKRGFVLGIYATVLSLGFAGGPWLFAQIGSQGFLPFGVTLALVIVAAIPVLAAWRESPTITPRREGSVSFLRYIWLVPTATAAVLVFGAVETGGFALFPVYGARIPYSEADAALLLSMIGLGNVLLQIPLGMLSDRISDRRHLLLACAIVGLVGTVLMPWLAFDWHLMAGLLFIWGLSGHELASANAAFVLCYGLGMVLGPQAIGIAMDLFGTNGFSWALALFFGLYILVALSRLVERRG